MTDRLKQVIRNAYAEIAESQQSVGESCCGVSSTVNGYAPQDLATLPSGADLGVGCGNPVGIAASRPGQVVLDLGSGAGIDCFLASKQVGPEGKVIGVDMTPQMVQRARRDAQAGGYDNVEFRVGEIEHLPVADASVDLVISNCVIDLVPDQAQAFAEAFRVLLPGGRLVVSDTVTIMPQQESTLDSEADRLECITSGNTKESYLDNVRAAGFEEITIVKEVPYPMEMAFEDTLAKGLIADLEVPEEAIRQAAKSMMSITFQAIKPLSPA